MMRTLTGGLLLLVAACTEPAVADGPRRGPRVQEKAEVPAGLPSPDDLHYGIYLNGHKVGWMRSTLLVGERVQMKMKLHAAVGGLGKVSTIDLDEERTYDVASKQLRSLSFSQTAATGSVRVIGEVQGKSIELSVTAGNATKKQTHEIEETLDHALAAWRLATEATVGAKASAKRFDASILKNVDIHYRVTAVDQRMIAGVKTKIANIEADYPALGVKESSWLDPTGKLLETQVGGFFVARLEPPDVAKRLDYSQDILVSAVVKSPQPIVDPEGLDEIRLTFTGFGDVAVPSSSRQIVEKAGERTILVLRRDAVPPTVSLATRGSGELVEATPFIQSDAPDIVAAARRAVGDAKTVYEATSRLSSFVFEHVRDEYVPAYSNALESLQSGRGDCTEHSILFVALARALGIPARVAVGIAYWPAGGGFGWHAWAEVKSGDAWYSVDPTWNQPIADATHVKLADGGPAEQARIVMLLGRLKIVDVAL